MRSATISKSDFLRFLQCPRYAWLWKHHPELRGDSGGAPFALQGHEVELLARKLFPKGKEVVEHDKAGFEKTKALIHSGAKILYQATARTGKLLAKADILVRDEDGRHWHLYEVKSSAALKEEYMADVYFQWLAFEGAGIHLASINVVLVNNQFILPRNGRIDPKAYFSTQDLTADLPAMELKWKGLISIAHRVLTAQNEPKVLVLNKSLKREMSREMIKAYWKGTPEYSVYRIAYITRSQLTDLIGRGIIDMQDVPDDYFLTERLARQVRITKNRETHIDRPALKAGLDQLRYPLFFLDYETIAPAIPMFPGNHPFQNLPFQYSLHVLEKHGSEPRHFDFLHTRKTNPAPHLLKSLKSHIGDKGTVLAWNAVFEKTCNADMARGNPNYAKFLESVNERMVDLALFFKDTYVDYRFKGSASLKNVLPVLAPELTYESLQVRNGEMAVQSIQKLLNRRLFGRSKIIKELKEYCRLDTYAMVRIHEILRKMADAV